jgi:hypothetical protein
MELMRDFWICLLTDRPGTAMATKNSVVFGPWKAGGVPVQGSKPDGNDLGMGTTHRYPQVQGRSKRLLPWIPASADSRRGPVSCLLQSGPSSFTPATLRTSILVDVLEMMRLKAIFCERLVVAPLGILASPPFFYSSSSYRLEGFCVCTTPGSRHMLSFEQASLCPPCPLYRV